MSERVVVGADTLPADRFGAATTDGRENQVWMLESQLWSVVASWPGPPITAFCSCGESLLALTEDGIVHAVRRGQIHRSKTNTLRSVGSMASIDDNTALLGGATGSLAMLQVDTLIARTDSLAAHAIESPGRAIFNIQRETSSLLILGDNQLLVTYRRGRVEPLLPPGKRSERVYKLWYAGTRHGETLVSGFYGVSPVVAALRDGALVTIQAPTMRDTAAQLVSMGDELYILSGGLWRREGEIWSPILRGSDTDPFVYLGGETGTRQIAITERGHCLVLSGEEWSIAGGIP